MVERVCKSGAFPPGPATVRYDLEYVMKPLIVIPVLLAVLACSPSSNDEPSPAGPLPADLVLTGGTVITMDAEQSEAEAVAVRHGRIAAVGTTASIEALIGDATVVIDLAGSSLLPGFIEGHGHFLGLGEAQMILDLQEATSFSAIVDAVAEAAGDSEPGTWILGRGWHQERFDPPAEEAYDGMPTHHALSAVSPDHPVLLTHASGHASFVNARALAVAGIDRDTPNPEGGTIVRDADGEPTGFLRQAAQIPARRAAAAARESMSESEREARFHRQVELASAEALRHGVTSFHDQGTTFADIDRLMRLAEAGELPIRLHVAVRGESNADMDRRLADYRVIGHGNEFLTVRAIKRAIDGALGTHGAWLLEPYSDKADSSGLPQTSIENLRETADIAARHGFQLHVHAIGDRGNRVALDVFESVFAEHGPADRRWRIEHAQNLHPEDVPRFTALGVVASMQGVHATSDGPWVPQRLGEARARERAYVWRALLDEGAIICNGTDVPVEPISPIASLHASVTREMANGERFFPEQAMGRLEALWSYTVGCAFAGFTEDRVGTIAPGKLADFVVLDGNPLTVTEDALKELEVQMTLVHGEVRYRR